jgi:hypothetical protein
LPAECCLGATPFTIATHSVPAQPALIGGDGPLHAAHSPPDHITAPAPAQSPGCLKRRCRCHVCVAPNALAFAEEGLVGSRCAGGRRGRGGRGGRERRRWWRRGWRLAGVGAGGHLTCIGILIRSAAASMRLGSCTCVAQGAEHVAGDGSGTLPLYNSHIKLARVSQSARRQAYLTSELPGCLVK